MRTAPQPENLDQAPERWTLETTRLLDAIRAGDVEAARRHLAAREGLLAEWEAAPRLSVETRAKIEAAMRKDEALRAGLRSQMDVAAGELRCAGHTQRTLRSYGAPNATGRQIHEVI